MSAPPGESSAEALAAGTVNTVVPAHRDAAVTDDDEVTEEYDATDADRGDRPDSALHRRAARRGNRAYLMAAVYSR